MGNRPRTAPAVPSTPSTPPSSTAPDQQEVPTPTQPQTTPAGTSSVPQGEQPAKPDNAPLTGVQVNETTR